MNILLTCKTLRTPLVLFAVFTLGALVHVRAAAVGEPFPALSGFELEGNLPDTKGKVVLLDFFASWCGPCKASFPAMQQLHEKYKSEGLVVLGVNVDSKKADMEKFLKKYPVDFAITRDGKTKLVSTMKIETMPTSFLLDRDGKVRFVHSGFRGEETKREYAREIEQLLK